MFKLVGKNGEEIFDDAEMLKETRGFYEQLYKKRIVRDANIEDLV